MRELIRHPPWWFVAMLQGILIGDGVYIWLCVGTSALLVLWGSISLAGICIEFVLPALLCRLARFFDSL